MPLTRSRRLAGSGRVRLQPITASGNTISWGRASPPRSILHVARIRIDFEFLFEDEIATRLAGNKTFSVRYAYAAKNGTSQTREAVIRPDGIIGIRYLPTGEERILIREEDCKTERNESDDPKVKSHKNSILQYSALIGNRENRQKYFGTARAVVLSTFSSEAKKRNVMELVLKLSGGKGANFLLYRAWPAFGDRFRPPVPDRRLFDRTVASCRTASAVYINALDGMAHTRSRGQLLPCVRQPEISSRSVAPGPRRTLRQRTHLGYHPLVLGACPVPYP